MRIIEVVADRARLELAAEVGVAHGAIETWGNIADGGSVCLLVPPASRQAVLDALQGVLAASESRILIRPVEAALPREKEEAPPASGTSREELYDQIERGARLDRDFIALVLLSAIVASIGLLEDSVAIVVGAMVIAPLLGPNLGLALGTSMGDRDLIVQSLRTNAVGLGAAMSFAVLIGLVWDVDLGSAELVTRTVVGLDSVVLALAAGAAAVLSLATGLPSALVGVMVAVALMPPVATMGMMLGAGHWEKALGAGLLLGVNIVSVNLAAKLVFLAKGVKPRTWLEKRKARQSMRLYFFVWGFSLLLLVAATLLYQRFLSDVPALPSLPMP